MDETGEACLTIGKLKREESMSKPVNTALVGAFVVGAIGIVIAMAFFISGNGFGSEKERAVMVFDSSVKGLKIGAPVAFRGVQIGQVTNIELLMDAQTYDVMMPVYVDLNTNIIKKIGTKQEENSTQQLIDRGMRAQLQSQSLLTGLLYVQLDFHPGTKLNYREIDSEVSQLPTIRTDMEKLSRNLQNLDFATLFENIRRIVANIDVLLSDPQTGMITGNMNETLDSLEALSQSLQTTVEKSGPGVNSLIANSDKTMQELSRELPQLSASIRSTLADLSATLQRFEKTLGGVDYNLSDDSPVLYDVRKAARELGKAGRSLQSLAETLEEQPESILKGKSPLGE
jgi:paraquat-inducible protein B